MPSIYLIGDGNCVFNRPEVNIKPWDNLLNELREGNKRTRWMNREPYAYWKGNPAVAETRQDLLKCNLTDQQDWNARLYAQVVLLIFLISVSLTLNCSIWLLIIYYHCINSDTKFSLQDWIRESQEGYKKSDLASQCIHR